MFNNVLEHHTSYWAGPKNCQYCTIGNITMEEFARNSHVKSSWSFSFLVDERSLLDQRTIQICPANDTNISNERAPACSVPINLSIDRAPQGLPNFITRINLQWMPQTMFINHVTNFRIFIHPASTTTSILKRLEEKHRSVKNSKKRAQTFQKTGSPFTVPFYVKKQP